MELRLNCPAPGCAGGSAQRGARDPSSPVAKRLDVDFRSSELSSVPKMTTLSANSRRKKSVLLRSTQAHRSAKENVGTSLPPPSKFRVSVFGTALGMR